MAKRCLIKGFILFNFIAFFVGSVVFANSSRIQFPDVKVDKSKLAGPVSEFVGSISYVTCVGGGSEKPKENLVMKFDKNSMPEIDFKGRKRKAPILMLWEAPKEILTIIKDLQDTDKDQLKKKKFLVEAGPGTPEYMKYRRFEYLFVSIKDISGPPIDYTKLGLTEENAALKMAYSGRVLTGFTLGDFFYELSKSPNNKFKMAGDDELIIETKLGKARIHYEKIMTPDFDVLSIKKVDEKGQFNKTLEGFDAGAYVISIKSAASDNQL